MKKNIFILFALSFTVLSCNKDDDNNPVQPPVEETPGTLKITFQTTFEGEPFELYQEEINAQDCKILMSKLDFYFSDLLAIKSNGEELHLSEIEFYSKSGGQTEFTYSLPAGNYNGIKFGLGVPEDMNSPSNPDFTISIFDQDHPLSESNGMYWTWANGYRFFSLDGKFNTDPDFEGELLDPYSFHSGMDTMFREIPVIAHEFSIASNSTSDFPVGIEIDKIFSNNPDHINLLEETSFHGSVNNIDVGIRFANASAASFIYNP